MTKLNSDVSLPLSKKEADKKIFQVANYFIGKAKEQKIEISQKKLQKLLYYAQAWYVTIENKKLFQTDFEAWIHGPAAMCIYNAFCKYGRDDIAKAIEQNELDINNLKEKEKCFLDVIWKYYGQCSADQLEALTHNETPWKKARGELAPYEPSRKIISTKSMADFYGKKC